MSRAPLSATIQEVATTVITTLGYIVPANTVASPSMDITNLTTSINTISVYINNGNTDFLLVTKTIPAGIGKTWRVLELHDQKLNAGYAIKVQATTVNAFNVFLSVSEISDS